MLSYCNYYLSQQTLVTNLQDIHVFLGVFCANVTSVTMESPLYKIISNGSFNKKIGTIDNWYDI